MMKPYRTAGLWLLFSMCCTPAIVSAIPAVTVNSPAARSAAERYLAQAHARGLAPGEGRLLVVSVPEQRLALLAPSAPPRLFAVSTSKWGVGSRKDSNRTPLGWHRVSDWIGGRARPGQSFVSRKPTREVLPPGKWRSPDREDYVLTRIMWLAGLEQGLNRGPGIDTRSRYIYLHGTNQEHLLGQPASHGCIRLSNRDVMEVYDQTDGHPTYCWITEAPLGLE